MAGARSSRRPVLRRSVLVFSAAVIGIAWLLGAPSATSDPTCDTNYTGGAPNDSFTDAANWDNGVPDGTKHGCIAGPNDVELFTGAITIEGVTLEDPTAALTVTSIGSTTVTVTGDVLNRGVLELGTPISTFTPGPGFTTRLDVAGEFLNEGAVQMGRTDGTTSNVGIRLTTPTATLINDGTLSAVGGGLQLTDGGTVINNAIMFNDADSSFQISSLFVHRGTFNIDGDVGHFAETRIEDGAAIQGSGEEGVFNGNSLVWTGGGVDLGDRFTVSGSIDVSGGGTGAVTLTGGFVSGTIAPGKAIIIAGTTGVATSLVVDGELVVSGASSINMSTGPGTITNNGTLRATGTGAKSFIGGSVTGAGALVVEAGQFNTPPSMTVGDVEIASGASLNVANNAQLTLLGGTGPAGGNLVFGSGSTVSGTGAYGFTFSQNAPGGSTLAPGASPGALLVGALNQGPTSVTDIEIGGTEQTDHDLIASATSATLAGTLNLSIVNGYVPQVCDSFDIITGAPVSGGFSTVNGDDLGSGLTLVPFLRSDRLTLVVTDNGSPMSVAPTSGLIVDEAGTASDEFNICVATEPTAAVTVTFADAADQVTAQPNPTLFGPGSAPSATIGVVAIDDTIEEANPHPATIDITTSSADGAFDALVLPPVSVSVADDDGANAPPPPTSPPPTSPPPTAAPPAPAPSDPPAEPAPLARSVGDLEPEPDETAAVDDGVIESQPATTTTTAPVVDDAAEELAAPFEPTSIDGLVIRAVPRGGELIIEGDAAGCTQVEALDGAGERIGVADVDGDRFSVGVETFELQPGLLDVVVRCVDDGRLLATEAVVISQPAEESGPGLPSVLIVLLVFVLVGGMVFVGAPPPPADLDIIFKDPDQMNERELAAFRDREFGR